MKCLFYNNNIKNIENILIIIKVQKKKLIMNIIKNKKILIMKKQKYVKPFNTNIYKNQNKKV